MKLFRTKTGCNRYKKFFCKLMIQNNTDKVQDYSNFNIYNHALQARYERDLFEQQLWTLYKKIMNLTCKTLS